MNNKERRGFFKKCKLIILSCPVFIEISEEDKMIFTILLKICKQYGKINPTLLFNEFGLSSNISEKLLKIMNDKLMILKEIDSNENSYELSERINFEYDNKNFNFISIPLIKRIAFCIDPLNFVKHFIFVENLEEPETISDSIDVIGDINKIMGNNENKEIFNIPKEYLGLELSKEIKLVGFNFCNLFNNDNNNSLNLYYKNNLISKINKKHPDYKKLIKEHNFIKNKKNLLKKTIYNIVKEKSHEIDFIVDFDNNSRDLINITTSDFNKIGEILKIYKQFNLKYYDFKILNDWFYSTKLEVQIFDITVKFWIEFFDLLIKKLENKSENFFINDNFDGFFNKIMGFRSQIENFKSIKFDRETFISILKQFISTEENDWYSIIYSKIEEVDIFE